MREDLQKAPVLRDIQGIYDEIEAKKQEKADEERRHRSQLNKRAQVREEEAKKLKKVMDEYAGVHAVYLKTEATLKQLEKKVGHVETKLLNAELTIKNRRKETNEELAKLAVRSKF